MELDLNTKALELLNARLTEFQAAYSSDLSLLITQSLLQQSSKHLSEKEALQETINQYQNQVHALQAQLNEMRLKKSQSAKHANSLTTLKTQHKAAFKIFQAWKSRSQFKKNQHKKDNYATNFYRRGLMRNVFKSWKQAAHMIFIRHADKIAKNAVSAAEIRFRQETSEEVALLRKMVTELTEDLRAETIAKNNLKYMYDQAILRSMNALNIESINIQQTTMQKTRDMSDLSKQLLYTPDRFAGSIKSTPI